MAIKVMIVDDQPLLAEGIKSIVLSRDGGNSNCYKWGRCFK